MAAISLQSLNKNFDNTAVIRDVSLAIEDGEFTVFVGPSGCGKSTLLRLIAGLETVTSGDILFDQQQVTGLAPSDRGIAMVFQSYALYPHMSVYDNMAFGLKIAKGNHKSTKQEIAQRVNEAARILQIEHLLDRKPKELSGGQRQRVAIGRAIVRQPRVFLFDEPLSNLDAALRVQMRLELKRLHRDLATTMIYVTHDQVEAMTLADRIVVLNNGAIEQVGTPLELYQQPRNMFVAGFLGSPKMNFLSARVVACSSVEASLEIDRRKLMPSTASNTSVTVPLKEGVVVKQGQAITLGIRPEHLSEAANAAAQVLGGVVAVEHLGSETYIHLDINCDEMLVFKSSADSDLKILDKVTVFIDTARCHLFNEQGDSLTR
ncbi:MAG: sn-glycerol-3-phosphate ABC transporter ATP-binding protein UgpC [Pseudomonadales bacterium]|nr:sn-glycerol-3-phosphate ABC transporter ATP-binding protein UgpC [Pseudomonadales bacterium]